MLPRHSRIAVRLIYIYVTMAERLNDLPRSQDQAKQPPSTLLPPLQFARTDFTPRKEHSVMLTMTSQSGCPPWQPSLTVIPDTDPKFPLLQLNLITFIKDWREYFIPLPFRSIPLYLPTAVSEISVSNWAFLLGFALTSPMYSPFRKGEINPKYLKPCSNCTVDATRSS